MFRKRNYEYYFVFETTTVDNEIIKFQRFITFDKKIGSSEDIRAIEKSIKETYELKTQVITLFYKYLGRVKKAKKK